MKSKRELPGRMKFVELPAFGGIYEEIDAPHSLFAIFLVRSVSSLYMYVLLYIVANNAAQRYDTRRRERYGSSTVFLETAAKIKIEKTKKLY